MIRPAMPGMKEEEMFKKLKNKIIRRLGGVPIWFVGRDPIPGKGLIPVSTTMKQDSDGICITVEYRTVNVMRYITEVEK